MAEEVKDIKGWEPPSDWSDMRQLRTWLKSNIEGYDSVVEMLEVAVRMAVEVVRCEKAALPSLPEGEADPEPHERLVETLTDPPEGGTAPKKPDKTSDEPPALGQVGSIRWEPDWANMQQVRTWLTFHAVSRDNLATQLECLALTLRAAGQRLRDAPPPGPVEAEDVKPSPTAEAPPKKSSSSR